MTENRCSTKAITDDIGHYAIRTKRLLQVNKSKKTLGMPKNCSLVNKSATRNNRQNRE